MVSGEAQVTRRGGAGGWGRRRVLALGLGGAAAVIAGGVTGVELVSRGVLPGKTVLDRIDAACSVPSPRLEYAPLGPSFSGAFYSRARLSLSRGVALRPGKDVACQRPEQPPRRPAGRREAVPWRCRL